MPFRPPFLTAGERFAKNTSGCRIKLIYTLTVSIHITPWQRPWPTPADGDSLNQHHRGGKRLTMVMMFVGGLSRCSTEFSYYSYSTKPTVREFFDPKEKKNVFLNLNIY